jgi:GNAT superfamily N-acetyltransferase
MPTAPSSSSGSALNLRPADASDVPLILAFIRELAEYEKLPQECHATEAELERTLFGPRRFAEVILAFEGELPLGFALFFHNYSTWLAKPGIYLEDLYVRPEHRGKGAGKALLVALAKLAVERGCGRVEWSVLDWNTPSIEFYRALGARPMDEWTTFRLSGEALSALARK